MISHSIFKKELIAPDSITSDKPLPPVIEIEKVDRNELKE